MSAPSPSDAFPCVGAPCSPPLAALGLAVCAAHFYVVGRVLAVLAVPAAARARGAPTARYVGKNLAKAMALAALAPLGLAHVVLAPVYAWSWPLARATTIMYAQIDMGGLLLLAGTERISRTTYAHHAAVAALSIATLTLDPAASALPGAAFALGAWSTVAWSVNAFLALRWFPGRDAPLRALARAAASVYTVCIAGNAASQAALWLRAPDGGLVRLAFAVVMFAVLRDDLLLLEFLVRAGGAPDLPPTTGACAQSASASAGPVARAQSPPPPSPPRAKAQD